MSLVSDPMTTIAEQSVWHLEPGRLSIARTPLSPEKPCRHTFMSPHIGRHSDIFASYVIARLAEHFDDVIAFGMPLANHARDTYPRDLWHDFDIEKWGMQNTDIFCDTLRDMKLTQ